MRAPERLLKASLLAWPLIASHPPGQAAEYYVSLSGKDSNPGTIEAPFRSIAKGLSAVGGAGDVLNLRKGVYVETVTVAGKHGAAGNPIVIRSYPGEHAYVDGSLARFRTKDNADWEPAVLHDPAAHPDEYVSVATFTEASVNRGAFLDRNPYTRLITYSRLEDLRADNQTFDKLAAGDPRPGPAAFEECAAADPDPACAAYDQAGNRYRPAGYRRPWVYMGPGIWFDGSRGKIHIRLSHTTNNIAGLADYTGEVDPRRVRLAIAPKGMTTLFVRGSSHLRIENLSVRSGGEYTVQVQGNASVAFDHVRIFAGSYGLRGKSDRTVFSHCEFDGGLPTWYFRSDRKSEYYFLDATGSVVLNNVGKQTLLALLLGNPEDLGTEIANCEFRNAHDVYLVGRSLKFHHNWVHNINDEGLFLDSADNPDLRIFQNVITKTLSPISFAGGRQGGPRYIYRNLVDARTPTAGYRPRFTGDTDVWRYGNTFKSNLVDGRFDLFQNTFLVYAQGGQASYLHYRNLQGASLRRAFNNIFVAVNPDSGSDRAIMFLPSPCFPGPTDGNVYHRIGAATRDAFRYLDYACNGLSAKGGTFATVGATDGTYAGSGLFQQSKSQYAPGYEAHSQLADPRFRRIGADGVLRSTDDLRLAAGSPAIGAGVVLPADLATLDPVAGATPDVGAYPAGSAPLAVGVDGRRSFPSSSGQ